MPSETSDTSCSPGISPKATVQPVDSLKPNPRNARTHSRAQIAQIAESISQFGFTNPILIDENGVVLAGHGRLAAAKTLGIEKVPVIQLAHLSDVEKRAFVLADNKIALNAGWDGEMLAAELGDLADLLPDLDVSFDLEITGFPTGESDQLLLDHEADGESPPEEVDLSVSSISVSQQGDLWQLGKHRLLCGDAQDGSAVTRLLGDAKADMVFTDPPYNVPVQGHVGGRGARRHKEFAFASGEMSPKDFRGFLKTCLGNLLTISSANALHYVFMDWRHIEDLLRVGRKLGLDLKNICVWNKTTPGQGSFYRSAHELVAVFAKPGARAANNIALGKHGRNRTNVWTYAGVNTFQKGPGADLSVHPTVKPISLVADAIKDGSKRGAIVLDPFLGSGTTLLAAEKVGRRASAIEYEPAYVDIAVRRWQAMTGRDAVLVATGDAAKCRELPNGGDQGRAIGSTFNALEVQATAAAFKTKERGDHD